MSYGSIQIPTEIRQKNQEKLVEISWDDGQKFEYTMEYLRVFCPCAGCRGHTPSQRKLIDGKQEVIIQSIAPVGHYAIKIQFSDNHDSGLFSWETLYDLGLNRARYWEEYLMELQQSGKRRKSNVIPIHPIK
ncbi:MAG: DUF971 domain-containing protein [Magnetococcus sp. DMHC-6]